MSPRSTRRHHGGSSGGRSQKRAPKTPRRRMLLCERIRSRRVVGAARGSRSRGRVVVPVVFTDDDGDARARTNAHRRVNGPHRRAHDRLRRRRGSDVDGASRVEPPPVRAVHDDVLASFPRALPKVLRRHRRIDRTRPRRHDHHHQVALAHDGASPRAPKLVLPRRRARHSSTRIDRSDRSRARLLDTTAITSHLSSSPPASTSASSSVVASRLPQRAQTRLVPLRDPLSRHLALAFGHLSPIRDSTQAPALAHCVARARQSAFGARESSLRAVERSNAPTRGPR